MITQFSFSIPFNIIPIFFMNSIQIIRIDCSLNALTSVMSSVDFAIFKEASLSNNCSYLLEGRVGK